MTNISHALALTESLRPETLDELESTWSDFVDSRAGGGRGLYDLIGDELYGLALWTTGSVEDACDVVQTVFLKLLERLVGSSPRKSVP